MTRFFFHIQDASTTLDDEGTELPDVNAARQEAIRACGEMIREIPATIRRGDAWRLWVTDQPRGQGHTLFTLTVAAENGEKRPAARTPRSERT
jgi:hypothetical protein